MINLNNLREQFAEEKRAFSRLSKSQKISLVFLALLIVVLPAVSFAALNYVKFRPKASEPPITPPTPPISTTISPSPTTTLSPTPTPRSGVFSLNLSCISGNYSYSMSSNGEFIGKHVKFIINRSSFYNTNGWGGGSVLGSGVTGYFFKEGKAYNFVAEAWDGTTLLGRDDLVLPCGTVLTNTPRPTRRPTRTPTPTP